MKSFTVGPDPEFKTPRDYILGITEAIWEDRGLDLIRRWYSETGPVRSPAGIVTGSEAVIAATLGTLNEFPDRKVLGEDVICHEPGNGSFYSSHRIISTITHKGQGPFGLPTGRAAAYRIIADCWCKDNQILEEWLIRDAGAMATQLGTTPQALARAQVRAACNSGQPVSVFKPENDAPSAYQPVLEDTGLAATYGAILNRIWRDKALRTVGESYERGATVHGPSHGHHHGHDQIDHFLLGFLAAFPLATFSIEHLFARTDEVGRPHRATARWSLRGPHTGFGRYGEPTGQDVYIMGISQAELADGKITREYTLVDDVVIWKQVLANEIAAGPA